jgi:hypothetical protein
VIHPIKARTLEAIARLFLMPFLAAARWRGEGVVEMSELLKSATQRAASAP